MCRSYFPEVLSGFYTELEIQDSFPDANVDINVNEQGEIILTNNNK